jgi:hypothetical protein
MLLAKLALGFCATVAAAGVYTFHEGVMRVDEDNANGRHVHVWFPAAIVPMALYVTPSRHLEHAASQAGPWLPTVRALAQELKKYPEAELVEVENAREHVHIRTHRGKLLIDVTDADETVHVACPLAMIEDTLRELEAKAPAV